MASVYQSQPNNWQIGNWNYMAAIQQALVLTAGFAARNPAIGGPATIGVGVTGELNTYAPKAEDISADISNGMSDAFQGAMGGLKAMLGLAMAGKDLTGRGKTTADLPNRTGNWKNDITKFFDQGRFLISDQQAAIQPIISGWAKYSKQIMAVKGLMAQGYFVFIDSTITTEADCTGAGGSGAGHAGRKWINDGKAQSCASLWKFGKYTKKMLWATNGAQEDTMTKAMQAPSTGGFNLKDVYTNAVQCARAHPGGNGQMVSNKNLVPTYITSAPPCFYNFQVVKGHAINLAFAQHLTVDMSDPINTSGR